MFGNVVCVYICLEVLHWAHTNTVNCSGRVQTENKLSAPTSTFDTSWHIFENYFRGFSRTENCFLTCAGGGMQDIDYFQWRDWHAVTALQTGCSVQSFNMVDVTVFSCAVWGMANVCWEICIFTCSRIAFKVDKCGSKAPSSLLWALLILSAGWCVGSMCRVIIVDVCSAPSRVTSSSRCCCWRFCWFKTMDVEWHATAWVSFTIIFVEGLMLSMLYDRILFLASFCCHLILMTINSMSSTPRCSTCRPCYL